MHNIKVYSTPTCPYCQRLKDYLKGRNIPFENIDVSVNTEGLQEMVRLSGQMGVPVSVIDGEVVVGFERAKIEELLRD